MEHSRIAWKSDESQSLWQPRISRIQQVWDKVERESVAQHHRVAALQFVSPKNVPSLLEWAKAHGIHAQIVDATDYQLRIAFSRADSFQFFWKSRNDTFIGELLGYPNCCSHFFNEVWNNGRKFDTTLSMANTGVCDNLESNILLRWAGVRFVPFLPCSFDCVAATAIGKVYAHLVWQEDREVYSWMREMLSWPMRYSALHGAAIIDTPHFKIVATTDHTDDEKVIERAAMPEDYWKENGFNSISAMDKAHHKLMHAFSQFEAVNSILDLGCGNGVLLDKLIASRTTAQVYGIDTNAKAIKGAEKRLPFGIFKHGNIYDRGILPSKKVTVALVSINRFFEVDPQSALRLIEDLNKTTDNLIVYSYDTDNIDKPLMRLGLAASNKWSLDGGVACHVKLPCSIAVEARGSH